MTGAAAERIETVSVEAYDFPLVQPWRSSHGSFLRRQGWFIRLVDADGQQGVGECAPLVEVGTENPDLAHQAIMNACSRWAGQSADHCLRELAVDRDCVAARCALECALLDLQSRQSGRTLRAHLMPDASDKVLVNASVGAADKALADRVGEAERAGFSVFKVKIGIDAWPQELAQLQAAFDRVGPQALFRLDANGCMSPREAEQALSDLRDAPVECVEDPIRGHDAGALEALQAGTTVPIACDESVPRLSPLVGQNHFPVRRIVLKPMVLGGAIPALRLARLAAEKGLEVVVTTTLEAAPGRALVAHLASAIGSPLAHGLDTGRWFAEDVAGGPEVAAGEIRNWPDDLGLGISL